MIQKWKLLKLVNSRKELNDAARRVMFFLLDRENNKTRKLYPSHARLAEDTGLHSRSVTRGINCLIKYGFLRKVRRGATGRATEYEINYNITVDTFVQSSRQICPKQWTDLSDQLTNELTNKLTKIDKTDLSSGMKKNEVNNIIKNIAKITNPNYRAVVDGAKKKYLDPEAIRQRYVQKTGNYQESFKWKELYLNPKTSKAAWDYAVHLGIVKEFKKK